MKKGFVTIKFVNGASVDVPDTNVYATARYVKVKVGTKTYLYSRWYVENAEKF